MKKEEKIKFANNELIAKGNLEIIDKVFDTEYIVHSGGKDYKGHNFIKRWAKQLTSAISDIKILKIEFFMQKDNSIVWQRTMKGKHIANLRGIEATNQIVEWNEMVVSRFENEKIIEEWLVSEFVGELLSKSK